MNSPEPNTEMMRVVGKSDWFGGGVRITKVVAQTGLVKGLRFDEVKLPEEVVDLEVYMKVDLDREVR